MTATKKIINTNDENNAFTMENEKVFLTIDPDKFTETELLNVDGVWIEVDSNSIATTSLNGAKIKLLIQ